MTEFTGTFFPHRLSRLWCVAPGSPCVYFYLCIGPYDAIHVGAASERLPEALVNQLKAPGRMFIPVGTSYQAIWQIEKDVNGRVTKKELMDVMVSVQFPGAFDLVEFDD